MRKIPGIIGLAAAAVSATGCGSSSGSLPITAAGIEQSQGLRVPEALVLSPKVSAVKLPADITAVQGINPGSDGRLWFAAATTNGIGEIGAIGTTGTVTEYPMAAGLQAPIQITAGLNNDEWVVANASFVTACPPCGTTYQQTYLEVSNAGVFSAPGSQPLLPQSPNNNVRAETLNGEVLISTATQFPTNFYLTEAAPVASQSQLSVWPYPISAGVPGEVWTADSQNNSIDKIDRSTGIVTKYAIPTTTANPAGITLGTNGIHWFTEYQANKIASITSTGTIREFSLKYPNSGPQGIAEGPDGNAYFTESNRDVIGRITPTGKIVEYPNPVKGMYSKVIVPGANRTLYFAGNFKIGKVTIP